jgi:mannosyl-oligosaccharide glucosidase
MYVMMAALMSVPANIHGIVFRYTCEQGQDIHGYGWDEFDARTGGIQTIHDEGNGLDITISFVKVPGGNHGGSWGARIKATVRDDAPPDTPYLVHYYVAQEELGDLVPQGDDNNGIGYEGDVTFKGSSTSLGDYSVVITKGTGNHPTSDHELSATRRGDTTVVRSVSLAVNDVWPAKPAVFQFMQDTIRDMQQDYDQENYPPPWQIYRIKSQAGGGNAHVVQKVFEGGFEFDIIFSSASAGKEMTSEDITREIKVASESFGERFSGVFDLKAPYTAEKYQNFGKSMFSNLIGGIGYFYGHQVIDRSYADEYEEENEGFWEDTAEARARKAEQLEGPYELFTSVPSRPFFPRGFLWDEGFHLIPIADWDIDLTLEIVKSWYNTMDSDGWIPREQILGPEARSKVPSEFQVQYPHYANPPTLFSLRISWNACAAPTAAHPLKKRSYPRDKPCTTLIWTTWNSAEISSKRFILSFDDNTIGSARLKGAKSRHMTEKHSLPKRPIDGGVEPRLTVLLAAWMTIPGRSHLILLSFMLTSFLGSDL